MPRTAATPRGRILAVAGAAAALAGAGTAAAASASAATIPAATAATTTAAVTPAAALPAGLSVTAPRHALTTTPAPSPLAPAASTAPAGRHSAADTGSHGTAVTTTTTTARTGTTHAAARTARPAPARHHATAPARPYQMYDSVTPSAIPGGKAVATYADGPYAASPAALHGRNVTWIDTNGTDPQGATVLDVEPGDATPAGAAAWAGQRLDAHPRALAVIYTMRSEWAAAQTSIAALPHWQQHHIRWWIADPTGTPHLVPGSTATQWYWGTHYDISTVNPGF
jgi:hypothetical protein